MGVCMEHLEHWRWERGVTCVSLANWSEIALISEVSCRVLSLRTSALVIEALGGSSNYCSWAGTLGPVWWALDDGIKSIASKVEHWSSLLLGGDWWSSLPLGGELRESSWGLYRASIWQVERGRRKSGWTEGRVASAGRYGPSEGVVGRSSRVELKKGNIYDSLVSPLDQKAFSRCHIEKGKFIHKISLNGK